MSKGLIVILTGGVSRRMGRPKALLPLYEGSEINFLQRIEMLTEGLPAERIVVSSLAPADLETRLPVIRQLRPELGQLSSLLLGWQARGLGKDWIMSFPIDHPYVSRSTLVSLIEAVRAYPQARMWCPSYEMRGGHPVVFSRSLKGALESCPLEKGARPVVRSLGDGRRWVETNDPGVLWDTDTPELYQQYSRQFLAEERSV